MASWASIIAVDSLGGAPTLVQGGRCILAAVRAINTTAAAAYVQLFDAASTAGVTLGTTVPTWVVRSDPNDPSIGDGLPTHGVVFTRGIVAASTTTATGATGATQHVRFAIV